MSRKVEEDAEGAAAAAAGAGPLPKVIAFDLDATLWYPEMYELYGAPFKIDSKGRVTDRSDEEVHLYEDVRAILHELHTDEKWSGTLVAYASRTHYPEYAYEVMKLMPVAKGVTMHDVMDLSEVYPGDKKGHFRQFAKESGHELTDMLFFDNESRNCTSVSTLGVTCVHTPHGMTRKALEKGLHKYAAAKGDAKATKVKAKKSSSRHKHR